MIWALSDPHLSLSVSKPMDIFGEVWQDYMLKIKENWLHTVAPEDTVLLPGDISWGIDLAEAEADLRFLHELPGTKYLSRGNHDYWWSTLNKLQQFIREKELYSLRFLRLEAELIEDKDSPALVFGTRGWILPHDRQFTQSDQKVLDREVARLRMSINSMRQKWRPDLALICALHYPPLLRNHQDTVFTEVLQEYQIPLCLYGHLHGRGMQEAVEGEVGGVHYLNVSADHLKMAPCPVPLFYGRSRP